MLGLPTRAAPPPNAALIARRERYALRGLANIDVPVEVVDTGSGPPVVFLHGLVGLNDHWELVARSISHRARCVMLQVPLLALRDEDCSIDGATALTIRFLETHLRTPATIVGNSFGGHVALRIALERPDLLRGLVLAGSSGLIEKSMVSDIQTRPSLAWLQRKIGELFYDQHAMNPADVARAHQILSDRANARAMVRLSRTARKNHLGDAISRISCPTLIVWGRQDVVTPPEAAYEFHARIRGSRLVWFDHCGHAPMIEAAEGFADAMNAFLDDVDARGHAPA